MSPGPAGLARRLVLVPRPRRMEVLGLGPSADACPVAATVDPAVPAEGFTLTISVGDGARITHADEPGRRYAEALLDQLRSQPVDDRVVAVAIEDSPDLAVRAFLLDVSRDRVPTRETLSRYVELLALARFNQFQLSVEHAFAHVDHQEVWAQASPLTVDGDLVRAELEQAAGLVHHAIEHRLGPRHRSIVARRSDLAERIDGQRARWLARARPGGLADSLAHLERTLAADDLALADAGG